MVVALPHLDDLSRQNASQVKNRWGEVVRQVQQSGSAAVTNHSTVEMVLLTAATYNQLVEGRRRASSRCSTNSDADSTSDSGRFTSRRPPRR
ncbi:type II toxin-antitoxin system prevent-host-death family antitoxin [Variovorax paradoxus]|uniref:type II toxin-antitoxin system prevent-host-death family antitoxin n=1 Tax=Variovorax paradoxus TaxID=34073 RepID=UPI003D65E80F